MNYEILISICLGDNFPLQDEFLSKDCKTTAILEAKFNEEILQSDPIEINSVNPELATELGFRLNKKDFHQFRIERKAIKLQCFVEYSTLSERHFIGYMVLHLRDAQENTQYIPKYKWHVLLNPKYKGSSTKRPQLYLAFMVNKLEGDSMTSSQMSSSLVDSTCDPSENHFTRPLKKENEALVSSFHAFDSSISTNDLDANLKVKYKNKQFFIWDENKCSEVDCQQLFVIQLQIDKPRNLLNILGEKGSLDKKEFYFYFKYSLFGKQIKSSEFTDIVHYTDFKRHKLQFSILTFDKKMLKSYFESYPTIEIQFYHCRKVAGFVTTNLLRLFESSQPSIEGDYMIVPEDESINVKEPFPVVCLNITVAQVDQLSTSSHISHPHHHHQKSSDARENVHFETNPTESSGINHYYIAIDLRTIKLENIESCQILFQPFYLQFSYAFFGITEYIKTYPSIQFHQDNPQEAITIPHGFCGFNFATTFDKLCFTFKNIPFIVQLILDKDDTLLGTAELNLSCLLNKKEAGRQMLDEANDNFVNTLVHVKDELNDQIAEIQVVMFLQELQNLSFSHDAKQVAPNKSLKVGDELRKSEIINSLNDMIIETAHDLEMWKEEQITIFKNRLKQKEIEFIKNLSEENQMNKQAQLIDMENLHETLKNLVDREKTVSENEHQIKAREKELENKFEMLNQEIEEAIAEVHMQYKEKNDLNRNQLKSIEQDKNKCQERIYQLERKVREKDLKIKELESFIQDLKQSSLRRTAQNQRPSSLTRSVNTQRKIIITRDSDQISKSMIENKVTDSTAQGKIIATKPPPLRSKFSTTTTATKSISIPPEQKISSQRNESSIVDKAKKDIIKKGISPKDPPLRKVTEIDKRIQTSRLNNSKRI